MGKIDKMEFCPTEIKLVELQDSLERTQADLKENDDAQTEEERNEKIEKLLGE